MAKRVPPLSFNKNQEATAARGFQLTEQNKQKGRTFMLMLYQYLNMSLPAPQIAVLCFPLEITTASSIDIEIKLGYEPGLSALKGNL